MQLESKLLLGRVLFFEGNYEKTMEVLGTMNLTPEKPPTPYLARLTAQACAAKAIAQGKPGIPAAKSFSKLDSNLQTQKMIELYDKGMTSLLVI